MADLMQVSGLWKNTSANGEMYLQGKLGSNVRILIFKNKYKTADNQPDYQIYFAPVERKAEDAESAAEEDDFLGAPTVEDPTSAPPAARSATPAPARAAAPPPARPAPAPARPAPQRRTTPEPVERGASSQPPTEDFPEMEDPFAD